MGEVPVRLCCGQRHLGVVCPDGLVMCCLCYRRVGFEDLAVTDDGQREDVCTSCAAEEACIRCESVQARFGSDQRCVEHDLIRSEAWLLAESLVAIVAGGLADPF